MRVPSAVGDLEARQNSGTGITANKLNNGPCKPVTYISTRGSTELGNPISPISLQEAQR